MREFGWLEKPAKCYADGSDVHHHRHEVVYLGSALSPQPFHCNACGTFTQFVEKTAMRFVTLFFIIPVIPISGRKMLLECPRCKTRFERD